MQEAPKLFFPVFTGYFMSAFGAFFVGGRVVLFANDGYIR